MMIGTILLALALPTGLILAIDLFKAQHHSVTKSSFSNEKQNIKFI